MRNLRLLIVDNLSISNDLNHLPNSLRFLDWFGYSSKCLPSSFQPKEIVELNLQYSEIKYLWEGVKYLDMLKSMDLSYSANIIQTPDFTGFPRLERLRLSWCTNLVDVHPSIRQLNRLVVLDLEHCKSLTNLPCISTEMESLKILNLCGCSKIRNFLEFNGVLKSLSELHLSGTGIETLPSSIDCLAALSLLNLKDCCHLECLPGYMDSLMSLEKLDISGCRRLVNLPDSLWKIKCLKELDLHDTQIIEVPSANRAWQDRLKYQLSLNMRPMYSMSGDSDGEYEDYGMYVAGTLGYIAPAGYDGEPDGLLGPLLAGYDDSSRRVAFTILNHYLQGLLCQKTEFQTIIEMNNLPRWLTHQSLGNSISIELPPNWCNGRWMGFFLCAYFNVIGETFGLGARVIALGDMPHSHYASKTFFRMTALGSHIWLLYFSRDDWFATVGNGECSQIEVVFENYGSVEGVRECGVSLVYEQDVEEFNQTIAQTIAQIGNSHNKR
ncbi:probable WRKY transcription factor 19 [Quercus suber]